MPKKKWAILIAFAAAWLGYAPLTKAAELSEQESKLVAATFGCVAKDDKCVVMQSYGGSANDFINAAKILFLHNIPLKIDGVCGSACVTGADRALFAGRLNAQRRQGTIEAVVCITPRANLMFHEGYRLVDPKKGYVPGNVIFHPPIFLNEDLQVSVKALGPLPRTRKPEEAKKLDISQALAIWPKCGEDVHASSSQ